ncbi:MAG: hypothetical protein IT440_03220 [Phycisphaeraceae bacterium]|nr:hypothetical protein [Phycisphaeraceae bacterium]
MKRDQDYQRRTENVGKWLGPSRFGLFFHWGIATGGGFTNPGSGRSLRFTSVAEFEAAVPPPTTFARNLVANATAVGAKYIIFTLIHTGDALLLLYPTKLPGFINKTRNDYVGAVLDECAARGVKCLLYFPCCPDQCWNTPGGPWIDEHYKGREDFAALMKLIIAELTAAHGSKLAGFWMDGGLIPSVADFPAFVRTLLPEAVFNVNNWTRFDFPGMDMCTTEFCDRDLASPLYNRPGALRQPHKLWKFLPPPDDFNEDIPTCNNWFHHEGESWYTPDEWQGHLNARKPYLADKTYLVKELVTSLGQRGQWNYALGIGPKLDGTLPNEFKPMFANLAAFMAWAKESIHGTTGGINSLLAPGWWNDGAFGSITRSLAEPETYYIHVTTPPETEGFVRVPGAGYVPEMVADLRTGAPVEFKVDGTLIIQSGGWGDVAECGDKVFKLRF